MTTEALGNQAGYDRWASFYDTYPNPTVALDELVFPRDWQHLKGLEVIEVGCGTGRHTQKLVDQGNHVLGIDISPGMLAVASQRLAGASARFLEADFVTYEGLSPRRFDALLCSLVMEHIADLGAFFAQVAYVLKPGGSCHLSEIHPTKAAQGGRANFTDPATGDAVYLESYPHTSAAVMQAATDAGLALVVTTDVHGDEGLAALNPDWARYLHQPLLKIWEFRNP